MGRGYFYSFFKKPFLSEEKTKELLQKTQPIEPRIGAIETEEVFYIQTSRKLAFNELEKLKWLLMDQHHPHSFSDSSFLASSIANMFNISPLNHFETPESTNRTAICQLCGIPVTKLEVGKRYWIKKKCSFLSHEIKKIIAPLLYDKMLEYYHENHLKSFGIEKKPEPLKHIPLLEQGIKALWDANEEYGTGMDEQDMKYYNYLFTELYKRNPTDAEFCGLGNANSEHSRHYSFNGKIIIDGKKMPFTLMQILKSTLKDLNKNSIIAFHDNLSAIRGFPIDILIPKKTGFPSPMRMANILFHLTLTCETHNHPCLWAAYPGAATGGGGGRRDGAAGGKGSIVATASAGFLCGNLQIPNYIMPWEDASFLYDPRVESPLNFLIKATNGCYNDGNEFGEPVISGITDSFGSRIGNERWEYIKPVMFTGRFGAIDNRHIKKENPQKGWLIIHLGGLAYRVGVCGGSASSMVAGENKENLDLNSVQRADGEMAEKADNVIRQCVHMGDNNPIESIHDQGAGGKFNSVLELMGDKGGEINLRKIPVGDNTLSPFEILVAEYQENFAVLIKPDRWEEFKQICDRERCPCAILGIITGDGKAVVTDEKHKTVPVNLELKHVFGEYPQKTIHDENRNLDLKPLKIPADLTLRKALDLVFKHLAITSKGWAVHKVDRSVTGKVAQQQCVGPLQIPLSNYSSIQFSPFSNVGEANSHAVRPRIGFISPQAMARMTLAEAMIKLMSIKITGRKGIKISGNWMLALKQPGGMAWLYDAAISLANALEATGIDEDGGKDSSSMAAKTPTPDGSIEIVKSPSTLVISTYVGCPDLTKKLTPDIKKPGKSELIFIDIAKGKTRLGGSVFAQCLNQVGIECPDIDDNDFGKVNETFDFFQSTFTSDPLLLLQGIDDNIILSAHKKSKGGLITTLCEMAFAGNCGINLELEHPTASVFKMLLNEEAGIVIECALGDASDIYQYFYKKGLKDIVHCIGKTTIEKKIKITYNGKTEIDEKMNDLLALWRETSYHLELQQSTASCANAESRNTYNRIGANYNLTFDPDEFPLILDTNEILISNNKAKRFNVAIIREEGSNSDEEMRNACFAAGLMPWDVTMTDLAEGRITLDNFFGIGWVAGFSFKDVFGAAKGWAGVIKYNKIIAEQIKKFYERKDTFSFGFCNGAQLMLELGLVPYKMSSKIQPRFITNDSEKFESRFVSVKIGMSPAIMLKGMQGSILGVHAAHGQGKFWTPDKDILKNILSERLCENFAPIRYVDDYGNPTMDYPFNPNGSLESIAAVCSQDGRHLAFMLHPERTAFKFQWPYWPKEWKDIKNSPWLRMFQNARQWLLIDNWNLK